VLLGSGDFWFTGNVPLKVKSYVKLLGSGPTVTVCRKTNGAQAAAPGHGGDATRGAFAAMSQNIDEELRGIVGFGDCTSTFASTHNLTADGAKGAYTVSVASTTGLAAGQVVRVDELSGAGWIKDPYWPGVSPGNVWASSDFRVVYPKHDPERPVVDDFSGGTSPPFPADCDHYYQSYTVPDRPTCEMKEIASVTATTVTFTTPLHISYRVANTARIGRYSTAVCDGAAVENLTCNGFDTGTIYFHLAKNCWIKDVEITNWFDKPIDFKAAFHCEARRVYAHGTPYVSNSAENYQFIYNWASADCLIEDCISIECDKVCAARAGGAGCVFGYNYMDRGYIEAADQDNWVECGMNASHLVGPHHVLFEGNWCWNADSDFTHGNSIHMTHFRNWYTGFRTRYTSVNGFYYDDWLGNQSGNPPSNDPDNGPMRCGAGGQFSYWHSFVGNVLGTSGRHSGWNYEDYTTENWDKNIWLLGWDPPDNGSGAYADASAEPDETVMVNPADERALIRDGNYDYLTNQTHWHGRGGTGSGNGLTPPAASRLPDSWYCPSKPSFFGATQWPWVTPEGATKTYTLPAKVRFDAGTPFA
jgi:hypothetical protein